MKGSQIPATIRYLEGLQNATSQFHLCKMACSTAFIVFVFAFLSVILTAYACEDCSTEAMDASNDFRVEMGDRPFRFSRVLYQRCLAHSQAMASSGVLFHSDLGDGVLAENVAMRSEGNDDGYKMTQQWIQSPGHRANLLGTYECFATALYRKNGKVWGTQMFGKC